MIKRINDNPFLLYGITDKRWFACKEDFYRAVEEALDGGITLLQVRDKHASRQELTEMGRELLARCRARRVPLIVNDDVEAAGEIGAWGVHVGRGDMRISHARDILGEEAIIGATAHSLEEALEAAAEGADYLGVGAAFGSFTKRDARPIPLEEYGKITAAVSIPVVAIGGITMENMALLKGAGIRGVAMISEIFAGSRIRETTKMLYEKSRELFGE